MTKDGILQYLVHTPSITNPAIVGGLIDQYLSNVKAFYEESNLTQLDDYLYLMTYNKIDYEAGARHAERLMPHLGACSAICVNGIYGRNYDWYYDNAVTFIIKTTATATRHASIGVASVKSIDKALVELNTWNDLYAVLPNIMLDGENDAGVVCNVNVVPTGDYGATTGSNPNKQTLNGLNICRYILDNADSALDAINKLAERNIVMPYLQGARQEVHIMIADDQNCFIVEFINNQMKVIEHNIMTNFYLYNVAFNDDGSVYTPITATEIDNAIITNHITPHGSGLERYNILNEHTNVDSVDDMIALMKSVYYTQMYTDAPNEDSWYTEVCGIHDLTVVSSIADFLPIMGASYVMYVTRDRSKPQTWQTVHTSVYDMAAKQLNILSQEGDIVYTIDL